MEDSGKHGNEEVSSIIYVVPKSIPTMISELREVMSM